MRKHLNCSIFEPPSNAINNIHLLICFLYFFFCSQCKKKIQNTKYIIIIFANNANEERDNRHSLCNTSHTRCFFFSFATMSPHLLPIAIQHSTVGHLQCHNWRCVRIRNNVKESTWLFQLVIARMHPSIVWLEIGAHCSWHFYLFNVNCQEEFSAKKKANAINFVG